MGQLDELFKDKDKWVLMSDQVDQLLTACYMQYRNVLNSKIGEEEGSSGSRYAKEKYETDIVWYLSYVKNTFLEVLIVTYGSHNELVYSTEH